MRQITLLFLLILLSVSFSVNAQQKEIDKNTAQKIEKYFQEKGEIYFKGKFHKVIGDEGEVVTKKIIVLSGDLKIKKKNYKIDFAYFPGD